MASGNGRFLSSNVDMVVDMVVKRHIAHRGKKGGQHGGGKATCAS